MLERSSRSLEVVVEGSNNDLGVFAWTPSGHAVQSPAERRPREKAVLVIALDALDYMWCSGDDNGPLTIVKLCKRSSARLRPSEFGAEILIPKSMGKAQRQTSKASCDWTMHSHSLFAWVGVHKQRECYVASTKQFGGLAPAAFSCPQTGDYRFGRTQLKLHRTLASRNLVFERWRPVKGAQCGLSRSLRGPKDVNDAEERPIKLPDSLAMLIDANLWLLPLTSWTGSRMPKASPPIDRSLGLRSFVKMAAERPRILPGSSISSTDSG
ncbi:hypothetical protein CI238_06937 [Colletotrichum incanum]|uniref:Uncharacterized protein n=1 Tax=Colletotrichum incanum TaxID=1573173 RepID=A0A167DJ29_COLIC|nr:hypothetical protein CI238_06937 [Colletotrichum incanum]